MKIRTEADVKKLDLKIKNELGIDVRKYRNQEVIDNLMELIVFPQYVVVWVIRPILIGILLYILGFWLIDLVHIEYLLYVIIGLPLFFISATLLGVLLFTWRMKTDIGGILGYSIDIMQSVVGDMNQIKTQINPENRKEVMGLIFQGVTHIVTIPIITEVVSEQVPLVGGLLKGFIKKVFTFFSTEIDFEKELVIEEANKKDHEPMTLDNYTKALSATSNGINKVLDFTFSIAQMPLKITFGIFFLLLSLFIYLIW